MKLSPKNKSRVQERIIPELAKLCRRTEAPVSLNELPVWPTLRKPDRIRIGRYFKKQALAGEIDGIRFAGTRQDNHSTYALANGGRGLAGFLRKLFG